MNRAVRRALGLVILIAAASSATAHAAPPIGAPLAHGIGFDGPTLAADASRAGVVNLIFVGPPGAHVFFDERVGASLKRLGSATVDRRGLIVFPDAVVWRCDRVVRSFEATAIALDGTRSHETFDVRTPSCASRFELDAPQRIAPGSIAQVRMSDTWQIGGIDPQLCITAPGGHRSCQTVRFERAVSLATRHFRAAKRGLWRIALRVGRYNVTTTVAVGGSAPLPKRLPIVLAAGDSTMQGIDSFLADGLAGRATVRSEVLIGSGVSSSLGWFNLAPKLAEQDHPRVTVVSIGANDSSAMQTPDGERVECCREAWIVEYIRRVRAMMKAYIQGGRGRVLWVTLPTARDPLRAAVGSVVNFAMRRAAQGLGGATILPFDELFTPNGYRDVMRWHGRDVQVRAPDGIHLSAAGTAIAAEVIEAAIGSL